MMRKKGIRPCLENFSLLVTFLMTFWLLFHALRIWQEERMTAEGRGLQSFAFRYVGDGIDASQQKWLEALAQSEQVRVTVEEMGLNHAATRGKAIVKGLEKHYLLTLTAERWILNVAVPIGALQGERT